MKLKAFLRSLSKLQLAAIFIAIVVSLGVFNVGLSNFYLGKITMICKQEPSDYARKPLNLPINK